MSTYTASIETVSHTFLNGFHLGTIESVARTLVEEIFHNRVYTSPTVTVALIKNRKIVDVYDGRWASDDYGPDMSE